MFHKSFTITVGQIRFGYATKSASLYFLAFACFFVFLCSKNGLIAQKIGFAEMDESLIKNVLGQEIALLDTNNYVAEENRPIFDGQELRCNLDAPGQKCCWLNWKIGPEKSAWRPVSGKHDSEKFSDVFGTQSMPEGNYFLNHYGSKVANGRAELASCTIDCSDHDVDISFKFWATENVVLKVCTRSAQSMDKLENCQHVKTDEKQQEFETSFPAAEYFNIIIVAENLRQGSTVIIDDIVVVALPCATSTLQTTTTSEIPTTTTPETMAFPYYEQRQQQPSLSVVQSRMQAVKIDEACTSISCNFEKKSGAKKFCSYQNGGKKDRRIARRPWHLKRGVFKDRQISGIRSAGQGFYYAATHLFPTDSSILESPDISFDTDLMISFLVHKTILNVDLRVCCSTLTSCPFSTEFDLKFNAEGSTWASGSLVCPKNTTKIIFYAFNSGDVQGVIGIDNISLIIPYSKSISTRASYKVC